MKAFLTEKNIAASLFVLVMILFSIAQSETRKKGFMAPESVSVTAPAPRIILTEQQYHSQQDFPSTLSAYVY